MAASFLLDVDVLKIGVAYDMMADKTRDGLLRMQICTVLLSSRGGHGS